MLIALGSVYAAHLAQSTTATKAQVGNLKPEKVLEEASKDPSKFRVLDEGTIPGEEGKTVTYFWNVGAKIKIAFVGGDKTAREFVKKTAAEWLKYANVEFFYTSEANSSDVRISISNLPGENYSFLGIACRNVPKNEPTMRLSLPKGEAVAQKRRIVLHEFGHMLGLPSENQNPNSNDQINWDKFYQIASQQWGMNKTQVDFNFRPTSGAIGKILAGKTFDPDSIMMHWIPPEALNSPVKVSKDRGFPDVLSAGDQEFISQIYPRESPVVTIAQRLIRSTTNPKTKEALKAPAAQAKEAEKTEQATKLADALTPDKAPQPSADPEKVEQRVQDSQQTLVEIVRAYIKVKDSDPKGAERFAQLFMAAREKAKQSNREKTIYGSDDQYSPDVYEQIFKQSLSVGYLSDGIERLGTCFMIGKDLVLTCKHVISPKSAINPNELLGTSTLKVRFEKGADPANEEAFPVKAIAFKGTEDTFNAPRDGVDYAFLELGPSEKDHKLASEKGISPVKIATNYKPRDTAVYVIGYPGMRGNKTVADNARIFAGFNNSYETEVEFEIEARSEANALKEGVNKQLDPQMQLNALQLATKQSQQLIGDFTKSFKPGKGDNAHWYFVSQMVKFPPHAAIALDSDTFHGNSGSPVFTRLSSEVTAVLFRGMPDQMTKIKVGWLQHEEAIPIQVILQNWKDNEPTALAKYGIDFN